jgi:hypothetical protein
MNIGPFYFDKKELFLLVAIVLLGCALYFGWPLWVFKAQTLLTLSVIILLTKGLLRSINNDAFFFHVLTTLALAIFLSTFQVILFYLVTFVLFRLLKVI